MATILLLSTADTELLAARNAGAGYTTANPARIAAGDLPGLTAGAAGDLPGLTAGADLVVVACSEGARPGLLSASAGAAWPVVRIVSG